MDITLDRSRSWATAVSSTLVLNVLIFSISIVNNAQKRILKIAVVTSFTYSLDIGCIQI